MSGIIPSTVANGDSPKKATPIHTNDALSQFIKEQLVKGNFCIKTNGRNSAVATKLTRSKPSASKRRGKPSAPSLPIDSAWNTLRNVLKSKKEKAIYAPLCRFLTLLANKEFLFIPWDHKTEGEDELYPQDIIVVNAQPDEIGRFLDGQQAMDQLPSEFTYHEGGKLKPRVHHSNIQLVGEVKLGVAPESPFENAVQVLNTCLPSRATNLSTPPTSAFSFTVTVSLSSTIIQIKRSFLNCSNGKRKTLQGRLCDLPLLMCGDALLLRSSSRRSSLRIVIVYRIYSLVFRGDFTASDARVYRLFDLHQGQGHHRNAYVGIRVRSGIGGELNPTDWKVIKHYWHDMGRRFNELEILKKIHSPSSKKKLCTAGIFRVDLQESMELGNDSTPTLRQSVERQSVLLIMKTLGKALATCPSVMKFLKVMYDLVEGKHLAYG